MFPHPLASFVLFAFFPFAFAIFKRHPPALATAIVVLVGSLFLPEGAALPEMPLIPTFEKEKVTYFACFLAMLTYHRRNFSSARIGTGPELLMIPMMLGFLGSIAMNTQPVFNEGAMREELGAYWFFARSLEDFLTLILPFIVGRAMFRSVEDLQVLMRWIVVAGLVYTVLIVIEIVMAIPFHVWQLSQVIYGISLRPMWRWGVIQPIVFMDNGLSVASYMALAVICAAALLKAKIPIGIPFSGRARLIVLAGLTMTWNVAGVLYGYIMTIAGIVLKARGFARVAAIIAFLACLYPALRVADVFPDEKLIAIALDFDQDRARSLEGRFEEEEFVLGNFGDRFWVGWGMYDRIPGARSFGAGESGLDSYWIIRAGLTGIVGLEVVFLIMAIPVMVAWRKAKSVTPDQFLILLGAMMACVAVRMVDLLLNGLWNCLPFFLAGALYGVSQSIDSKPGRASLQRERGRAIQRS